MRKVTPMLLLFVLACVGEEPIVQRGPAPGAAQLAAIAAAQRTGVVHEVQMLGSVEDGFSFDPAELTIKAGDTVRWINGSGFPHNVAFYADSIPLGALDIIESAMPSDGKLGSMNGRIVSELGDSFEMDFVNAPLGVYHYFSVVQEAAGMVGTLTVSQ